MNSIELPDTIGAHQGQLLQAIPAGESDDAVPVDRFVIGQDQQLI